MSRTWIHGRHAVTTALEEGRVTRLVLALGIERAARTLFTTAAARHGIEVSDAPRIELDRLLGSAHHQGVAAEIGELAFSDPDAPFDLARARGEQPLLVALDHVTDPRNYGAIIRSAEALGAHGVISEARRSAPLTAVVAKTSAGAAFRIPLVQVTNLPRALTELKARGVWIYGADAQAAQGPRDVDYDRGVALVLGAEGEGLRRVVREACDTLVALPLRGRTPSLNVAVAAALLVHEAVMARHAGGPRKDLP